MVLPEANKTHSPARSAGLPVTQLTPSQGASRLQNTNFALPDVTMCGGWCGHGQLTPLSCAVPGCLLAEPKPS